MVRRLVIRHSSSLPFAPPQSPLRLSTPIGAAGWEVGIAVPNSWMSKESQTVNFSLRLRTSKHYHLPYHCVLKSSWPSCLPANLPSPCSWTLLHVLSPQLEMSPLRTGTVLFFSLYLQHLAQCLAYDKCFFIHSFPQIHPNSHQQISMKGSHLKNKHGWVTYKSKVERPLMSSYDIPTLVFTGWDG